MSNSGASETDRLRDELRSLRSEFRLLTVRVDQQEDRLSDLSALSSRGGGSTAAVWLERSRNPCQSLRPAVAITWSVLHLRRSVVPEYDEVGPYSWEERERVAREIGAFIVRAITGQNRGSSGRDKLKGLKSRYYLVVRDKFGQEYRNPIKVLTTFTQCKQLCSQAGDFGDSVFVGVPSIAETAGSAGPLFSTNG